MRINVLAFPSNGDEAPFSGRLDLSHLARWGERPFPEPVEVTGTVRRRHEQTLVEFRLDYTLHASCSRCLAPVARRESACFEHPVVERLEEDSPEEWAQAPDGMLELDPLAAADLSLSLESAPLCREDCRGLCPVCGADRNETSCGCSENKPADPRFAALLELLDDNND